MGTLKFFFSFDSIYQRGDRIFGWGWLFSPACVVQHVDLMATYEDGVTERITLFYGSTRADVAAAFPDASRAASSGFLLVARLRHGVALRSGCLRAIFDDGSFDEVVLPGFPEAYVAKSSARAHWTLRIKKALGEWRHAEFRGSIGFAKRIVNGWRERLRSLSLAGAVKRTRGWHVVFDHALGGGANRYRAKFVDDLIAGGTPAAVVTPHMATLTYALDQRGAFGASMRTHSSEGDVLADLSARDIACVTVNNLVSYDDPEAVIAWILKRKAEGVKVRVMLHDFYFVCPSFTLLDEGRKYCGVPVLDRCKSCLLDNDAVFLSFIRNRDQVRWRQVWWSMLEAADEVVAFSDSTVDIARRAYPALDQCHIKIVPHTVDYLEDHALSPDFGGPLVIGVVGHISFPKGAKIIGEMAEIIEKEGLDARIVVVGSIEGVRESSSLKQTGHYNAGDLASILEREKVTVGFLPSVIPETFSYVTSELIHMQLPMAVFDLGAPAERVRKYALGRVVPKIDARVALQEIVDFHHVLGNKTITSSRASAAMKAKS
jgi:glycosyltransferase involved in cell wall biosynthesis